jgi:peroxiredoxin
MALRARARVILGTIAVVAAFVASAAAVIVVIAAASGPREVHITLPPPGKRTWLAVGDVAPDFRLKSADGKRTVALRDLVGKKPVALIFGSYSCPPFRAGVADLKALYEKYRSEVEFRLIYVIEAHPREGTEGPVVQDGGGEDVGIRQAVSESERAEAARHLCDRMRLKIPTLVDNMQNTTSLAYSAMPGRLYLIDRDGRVAYQSRHGHEGLNPTELKNAIEQAL